MACYSHGSRSVVVSKPASAGMTFLIIMCDPFSFSIPAAAH